MDLRMPLRDFGNDLPGISVLCPTYGRASLLPEIVQSYLKQTYKGPSEFIILNDRLDQNILYFGDPRIKIINVKDRYETMGHKRNHLTELAQYPYVTFWDDDDIYLPERLDRGIRLLRTKYRGVIENGVFVLRDGGQISYERQWPPMLNMILEKSLITDVGGFPLKQLNQDVGLSKKIYKNVHAETDSTKIPTTIYRHLKNDKTYKRAADYPIKAEMNHEAAKKFVTDSVDLNIKNGTEPTGDIVISPFWKEDYIQLANNTWNSLTSSSSSSA